MEFASYIIYPAILLTPYLLYMFFPYVWERNRFSFYVAAYLPAAMFAALRGESGTDTDNYRVAFGIFDLAEYQAFSVDPIFTAVVALSKSLGFGFQGFSVIHASLCLLCYAYGCARLDKVAPVLGLFLLPVLFVDATFNGLRYGLAFAIATVAMHFYMQSASRLRPVYLLPPIAAHSSLAVFLFLFPGLLIVAVPLLTLVSLDGLLYFTYFSGKTESYSDFTRPGLFSGLMPLLQFATMLTVARLNSLKIRIGFNLAMLAIVVFITGLVLSTISYAGLRILQIGVFLLTAYVAANLPDTKRRSTMFVIVFVGLLNVANFLRQIFIVGPEGGVLFHPYEFFHP